MDAVEAGDDRIRCSTIRLSAVYCDSIIPLNIPAPRVRKSGSPALNAGFSIRFKRRSESTLTIVIA